MANDLAVGGPRANAAVRGDNGTSRPEWAAKRPGMMETAQKWIRNNITRPAGEMAGKAVEVGAQGIDKGIDAGARIGAEGLALGADAAAAGLKGAGDAGRWAKKQVENAPANLRSAAEGLRNWARKD